MKKNEKKSFPPLPAPAPALGRPPGGRGQGQGQGGGENFVMKLFDQFLALSE